MKKETLMVGRNGIYNNGSVGKFAYLTTPLAKENNWRNGSGKISCHGQIIFML